MTPLPIDPRAVAVMATGPAYARTQYGTESQATTREGVPEWTVPVLLVIDGRSSLVRVTLPAPDNPLPAVEPGTRLVPDGLRALVWEQSGRHGVSYRATTLTPQ